MAGHGSSYSFDNHPESSGYANDDFEKVDAPGSDHNGDHDSFSAAGSAAHGHDPSQDTEVSTTTDNPVGRSKSEDGVEATTSSSVKQKQRVDLLEQTAIYQWLVGLGSWLKGVDPRVKDLIYWRDVKKTGIVFGTMLVVLVSLAIFSLLSVVAYLSLAVLTVTFSFVVYKKIMGAVQKSNEGHPFKPLLDVDISLSEDKLKSVIQNFLKNTNATIREVRRLFLIEDTVDSIKFGILLWALTYIGSWFNGLSLIILATVLLFTLPKVYETYKVQIDNYLELAKAQINNVLAIIQSKVPFLKKKDKAQ